VRQQCNNSATAVRRQCNSSATAVRRQCNSSATPVRRQCDSRATSPTEDQNKSWSICVMTVMTLVERAPRLVWTVPMRQPTCLQRDHCGARWRCSLGSSPLGESPWGIPRWGSPRWLRLKLKVAVCFQLVFTKTARNAVSTLAASGATPEVAGADPTPYSTNTAQQRRSFLRVERHTRSVRLRFVIQMTNSLRDWCSVQVRDEPHGPQV
jgi:hypothetical protein